MTTLPNLKAEISMNDKKQTMIFPLKEGDLSCYPPLFCLHTPPGITSYYSNVSSHFNTDLPVYGIDSPAYLGIRGPFDRIEEMAAYYINIIRENFAEGPCFLMGHSSGAYIGYEMGIQMKKLGLEMPILIVLDSAAPIGPLGKIMDIFKIPDNELLESVEALFICAWCVSLAYGRPLPFAIEDLANESLYQRYQLVQDFLEEAGVLTDQYKNDFVPTMLKTVGAHTRGDFAYHDKNTPNGPKELYSGTTLVLRCTEETVYPGTGIVSPADKSTCSLWDKFCTGPIEVLRVQGSDHMSIILEPYVKIVANLLQPFIDVHKKK